MSLRATLSQTLESVPPGDATEEAIRAEALARVARGDDLIRGTVANRPDPHLVSYTLVTDGARILLCHHRKARLWLPTGGHVDAGETPRQAAEREVMEELGCALPLISPNPVFITLQQTKGLPPHRDLSLWFLFRADEGQVFDWDWGEFHDLRWFAPDAFDAARSEPQLGRCLAKLRKLGFIAAA